MTAPLPSELTEAQRIEEFQSFLNELIPDGAVLEVVDEKRQPLDPQMTYLMAQMNVLGEISLDDPEEYAYEVVFGFDTDMVPTETVIGVITDPVEDDGRGGYYLELLDPNGEPDEELVRYVHLSQVPDEKQEDIPL